MAANTTARMNSWKKKWTFGPNLTRRPLFTILELRFTIGIASRIKSKIVIRKSKILLLLRERKNHPKTAIAYRPAVGEERS